MGRLTGAVVCFVTGLLVAGCAAAPDPVPAPQSTIDSPGQATTAPQVETESSATSSDPASSTILTAPEAPAQTSELSSPDDGARVAVESSTTTSTILAAQSEQTTSTAAAPAAPPESLRFVQVAEGVRNPIFLTASPGAAFSYLAEQGGRILYLAGDQIADLPVLDITEQVTFRGEQGLLGMAIHPAQPHRLFVHYSDRRGHTVVSEFSLSTDGKIADPNSERIVFFAQQPATNHNGGMIQFGPDGYLYLGLGDGGRADDYYGHGQRPDTPLAAMVRIDPDQATFQVWWYGLRNPWRFWIDEPTDLVYIADVGQDAYEEISIAALAEPGLNFGWPITEGLHCFEPRQGCETEGQTLPVLEIAHGDRGTCSVTGGIVYRGPAMPGLWGHYFYSDYCGGYLRSFRWNRALATDLREWSTDLGPVVSFGTDGTGEMYVLTAHTVYRVEPGE